jgi:hypothetical protein
MSISGFCANVVFGVSVLLQRWASVSLSRLMESGYMPHMYVRLNRYALRSSRSPPSARLDPAHTYRQTDRYAASWHDASCHVRILTMSPREKGQGCGRRGVLDTTLSLPIPPQARVCVRNGCEAPTSSEEDNRISGPGLQTTTPTTFLCFLTSHDGRARENVCYSPLGMPLFRGQEFTPVYAHKYTHMHL